MIHFCTFFRRRLAREQADREQADRGQATPLIIGVVAIAAVSLVALAHLERVTSDAARAQAAADAAALVGVVDGQAAASRLAVANGATLVAFRRLGSDVIVTVSVGETTAQARATLNGGGGNTLGDRGPDRPPGWSARTY